MKLPSGPRILASKPDSTTRVHPDRQRPVNPERHEITMLALADREYIDQCRQGRKRTREQEARHALYERSKKQKRSKCLESRSRPLRGSFAKDAEASS